MLRLQLPAVVAPFMPTLVGHAAVIFLMFFFGSAATLSSPPKAAVIALASAGVMPTACRSAGVIVANHPGLLDAFYLLARVPRAFCVFKPAIRRNPLLGAAARRAGYLASDSGVELVRRAVERIGRGAALVIFPEGTRTAADGTVGRLRPGFAAIARHARVRVQLLRIATDRKLFRKGDPWWRLPELPVRVTVEVGPSLDAAAAASTEALVADVAAWLRGGAAGGGLTGTERVRTLTAA